MTEGNPGQHEVPCPSGQNAATPHVCGAGLPLGIFSPDIFQIFSCACLYRQALIACGLLLSREPHMSSIHIYWDESHFWGLLVTRALTAWGIPHRLVRGSEIAQGVLSGKSLASSGEPPKLLIVPGGRAKGKADRLGVRGMDAICDFVHNGGTYLGFCGGAGLALTGHYSLGLSPWTRKGYKNRLHHFLSGHVEASLNTGDPLVPDDMGDTALLPVWWPGRFDPMDDSVTVLARYGNGSITIAAQADRRVTGIAEVPRRAVNS